MQRKLFSKETRELIIESLVGGGTDDQLCLSYTQRWLDTTSKERWLVAHEYFIDSDALLRLLIDEFKATKDTELRYEEGNKLWC